MERLQFCYGNIKIFYVFINNQYIAIDISLTIRYFDKNLYGKTSSIRQLVLKEGVKLFLVQVRACKISGLRHLLNVMEREVPATILLTSLVSGWQRSRKTNNFQDRSHQP